MIPISNASQWRHLGLTLGSHVNTSVVTFEMLTTLERGRAILSWALVNLLLLACLGDELALEFLSIKSTASTNDRLRCEWDGRLGYESFLGQEDGRLAGGCATNPQVSD